MQKKYETVFFDLDHTLWDFESNSKSTILELIDLFGLQEKIDREKYFSDYSKHNFQLWDLYEKNIINQATLRLKRFELAFADQEIYETQLALDFSVEYLKHLPHRKKLLPGASDVLNYLHGKYKLAIITNGFEEVQLLKMINSSIHHYFDEIITSEKAGFMKPEEEIFKFALQITNSNSESSIMIGDNHHADIYGASRLNIDQIWLNNYNEKPSHKPTHEIKELKELLNIL